MQQFDRNSPPITGKRKNVIASSFSPFPLLSISFFYLFVKIVPLLSRKFSDDFISKNTKAFY
jgi:hypothetical protein